ncbi:MAG: metallophosphoesterase family protein [Lachnospiraceae bacterium]|nr:metallophosphoesterase family protein [Lachnospiraceae bacterium]
MKFAIVSDIHGNLPALDAVIKDAKSRDVDQFIFVGDYCLSNPYPNECIERVRNLEHKYVIRGNEEQYLENLIGKDQSRWTDGQMQISYWCFRNISTENLDYLLARPKQLEFVCNDVTIYVAHSSEAFVGHSEQKEWSTAGVAEKYGERMVSHANFCADIRRDLDKDSQFLERLKMLDSGVYIFGHTHIQWSYQSADGNKMLINPGSCGLPLDCTDEGAPYTILEISGGKILILEEYRVPYDKKNYLEAFLNSDQFAKANVWSKVILQELQTNREHLTFFLRFVENYAKEIGDEQRPFSVSTWEQAYALWQKRG